MSEHTSPYNIDCEDILADRQTGSDLRWAAREWEESIIYRYRKKLTRNQLFQKVLKSERVNCTINTLVNDNQSKKSLENKVISILEDMSHTLETGMIRKFALVLPKIMKKIYGKVFVNKAGIEHIKCVTEETPVIFLPTHRSYADFLLISYITFHYNLPFPVIAAGMDFMSMVVIGDMLRGAGAFYIRRSFMDDSLYWSVFQEYVQCLLCDSGQPMEFFLEGTRSRSGKSLPPKLGLLGCVVECWLRGKVPDIKIVPISISYNRTLEEKLYAYEMLGVPKPKESTSGLLKAMKILKEDFGNIYVQIGDSLSVSDLLSPKVERHLYVDPFHLSSLSGQELIACECLALRVSRTLQANCVVSIWSVACVGLLRRLWRGLWSVPWEELVGDTVGMAMLARRMGAVVEGGRSTESVVSHLRRSLEEHKDTALLTSQGIVNIQVIHQHGQKERGGGGGTAFCLSASTIESSVSHLLLQYYVNQVMHLFIRPILVYLAAYNSKGVASSREQIFEKYSLLTSVFSFDFIFEKQFLNQDFDEAFLLLEEEGCLEERGCDVVFLSSKSRGSEDGCFGELLLDLIRPFLLNYQVALDVAESQPLWESESALVSATQTRAESSASASLVYSSLSLDTCRHAAKMLIKMGALAKQKSSVGKIELIPTVDVISLLKDSLQPRLVIAEGVQSKL